MGSKTVQLFSISSIRIFTLLVHFLITLCLIWTRYPAVAITLSPGYSSKQYHNAENSYLAVISFSIILIILEFAMIPVNYGKVYFRTIISLSLDLAAIFFDGWIILDGLSWKSYVPIFIVCVLLPTLWETFFVMPHVYRYIVDIAVKCFSYVYTVILSIGRFFEELLFDSSSND